MANDMAPRLTACRTTAALESSGRLCGWQGSGAPFADEVVDQFGLNTFWIDVRRFPPSEEQLVAVLQLPEVAAAPVANRLAGPMPPKLIESFGKSSPPESASGRLSDVEHAGALNPRLLKGRLLDRRILPFEPSGGADLQKRRVVSAITKHDVNPGARGH